MWINTFQTKSRPECLVKSWVPHTLYSINWTTWEEKGQCDIHFFRSEHNPTFQTQRQLPQKDLLNNWQLINRKEMSRNRVSQRKVPTRLKINSRMKIYAVGYPMWAHYEGWHSSENRKWSLQTISFNQKNK